ncbi:hypothetical protein DTO013E5_5799 [Penicillium roqueforti]|nr:hypothetical protein DTO013F2_9610 [Penicillium roqueforti]KAI2772585.1 hypothetical protein DTO012A8_2936 [Penicillium roqueforti]KAI3208197.1 hypothetical protein DTO013E5_5799 [Penicillium roqueforti]KAI3226215.1 hypothetical protein DTO012A9_9376 [Penicillium roqueforti]
MAPIAPFSRHSRPPARLRHPPAPSGMASTATAQPGLAPPRPLLLPDASVPPSIKDHSPSCQVSHALSLSLPTRPPFFSPPPTPFLLAPTDLQRIGLIILTHCPFRFTGDAAASDPQTVLASMGDDATSTPRGIGSELISPQWIFDQY